ncbi:hypothetical protein LSAT2_009031 [Lamellibrachia satsuma]|nr:hypothetical protein LSAT2_010610 [Lamellibrachia satsuma]KAI0240283.1 hypothetical protein LSAT2_009031 [Lamellibrachia satsuma]
MCRSRCSGKRAIRRCDVYAPTVRLGALLVRGSEYFDTNWLKIAGYRNDYNVSVFVDVNNATCQQVTTPHSDKSFTLEVELPIAHDHLTVTAVLDGGECLDFPATMVYTKSDQSAMLPYHNNPSFCDNVPGECVFKCDCSAMPCQRVFLIILSAPTGPRKLCEIFIT